MCFSWRVTFFAVERTKSGGVVSSGVTAGQDALGDVRRVFEARKSVSVFSAPSQQKKKAKRRKGNNDELLEFAMKTKSEEAEVLLTELKERWVRCR